MVEVNTVHEDPVFEEMLSSIRKMIEDSSQSKTTMSSIRSFDKVPFKGSTLSSLSTSSLNELPSSASESKSEPLSFQSFVSAREKASFPSDSSDSIPSSSLQLDSSNSQKCVDFGDSLEALIHSSLRSSRPKLSPEPDSVSFSASEKELSDDVFDLSMQDLLTELENSLNFSQQERKNSNISEKESVDITCENPILSEKKSFYSPSCEVAFLSVSPEKTACTGIQEEDLKSKLDLSSLSVSLDELAINILRPMIQDWMDNHLPPLVEKLIREEMDRVVRGEGTSI